MFLLVCLTALVSLVQFPYSAPIYFCYVAPLAILTMTSIAVADRRTPRGLHLAALGFYLVFAVVFLNSGYLSNLGYVYERYGGLSRLRLERGGLRIPADQAVNYEALVSAIEERDSGPEIYAGPDCPEVYFLAGRRNPISASFEFLGELGSRPELLPFVLETRKIRVVVLNRSPDFSPRYGVALVSALRARYPNSLFIGEFVLMWKD
jgi:hypothetical protein